MEAGRLSVFLSHGQAQTAPPSDTRTRPSPEPVRAVEQGPVSEPREEKRFITPIKPSPASSSEPVHRSVEQPLPQKPKPATRHRNGEKAPNLVPIASPEVPAKARAPQPSPGARQAVVARLEDELARHFHYPFLARRRGWEGTVVLGLRVNGWGAVDSLEIAKSSGHALLDRAALDAATEVNRVPEADRLNGAELYLELPVTYQLRKG